MVRDAAQRVTDYLLERVGNDLRTVVILNENEWEGAYLRNDLREEYDGKTYERTLDIFRETQDIEVPSESVEHIGQRHAIVHYHDNAFVFQFPFTETETILISVEADVGRELLEFLEACRKQIHGESS